MPRTVCSKCEKPLDGSHKVYCKACFANYVKARYAVDPEKVLSRERQARLDNPGKSAEYQRQRYAENREEFNEYHREWRANHPEQRKVTRKRSHLKTNYGLTDEEFYEMLDSQGGICLICSVAMVPQGRGAKVVVVDHDDDPIFKGLSESVRGLICSNCNRGLGYFDHNPDAMVAAAAYMMRWQQKKAEFTNAFISLDENLEEER